MSPPMIHIMFEKVSLQVKNKHQGHDSLAKEILNFSLNFEKGFIKYGHDCTCNTVLNKNVLLANGIKKSKLI